jgi:hypothetical protein
MAADSRVKLEPLGVEPLPLEGLDVHHLMSMVSSTIPSDANGYTIPTSFVTASNPKPLNGMMGLLSSSAPCMSTPLNTSLAQGDSKPSLIMMSRQRAAAAVALALAAHHQQIQPTSVVAQKEVLKPKFHPSSPVIHTPPGDPAVNNSHITDNDTNGNQCQNDNPALFLAVGGGGTWGMSAFPGSEVAQRTTRKTQGRAISGASLLNGQGSGHLEGVGPETCRYSSAGSRPVGFASMENDQGHEEWSGSEDSGHEAEVKGKNNMSINQVKGKNYMPMNQLRG